MRSHKVQLEARHSSKQSDFEKEFEEKTSIVESAFEGKRSVLESASEGKGSMLEQCFECSVAVASKEKEACSSSDFESSVALRR